MPKDHESLSRVLHFSNAPISATLLSRRLQLFLGMHGATTLADAIIEGKPNSFAQYQKNYFCHIRSWQRIVDYYYTGELFTLFITGRDRPKKWYSKPFRSHVYRHMGRIFTGQAATQNYSLRLLDFMTKYAINSQDFSKLQIN